MDHFQAIYTGRAAEYHRMIAAEDKDGRILPAIERVAPLGGTRLLDLGTGTGRLPLLLGALPRQIVGLDLHRAMLDENRVQRREVSGRWNLVQADMRALPFCERVFDVAIAGWSIGHLRSWFADTWRREIGHVLAEMARVVEAGGVLVILETLTTGSLTPAPPTNELAEYYAWLEHEHGFVRDVIRTDYHFADAETAAAHTEFFFGAELAVNIQSNRWSDVPEWTGIWAKQLQAYAQPRSSV